MSERFEPVLTIGVTLLALSCSAPKDDTCEQSPGQLYEERVVPLLESDTPSSCSRCHAGGLDLEDLLRPDACESMACLTGEGLVDLENPERSVILQFILRAEPESELISEDVVQKEYEAFLSWIEHESECRKCSDATCGGRVLSSCDRDDVLSASYDRQTDPGDCDRTTIERLFRGTAYAERGRCSPCHYREETKAAPDAPRWLTRTGDCRVSSLATLRNIEESGYINVEEPDQSLIIQKPLAEFQGGLEHGGHDKFVQGGDDSAYEAFLYFVTRYAACETGRPFVPPSFGGGPSE